jgi:hypothetical protein
VLPPIGGRALLRRSGLFFHALGPVGFATTAAAGTATAVVFHLPVLAEAIAAAAAIAVAVVTVLVVPAAALMAETETVAATPTVAVAAAAASPVEMAENLGSDRSHDEAADRGPQRHRPVVTHQTQPFSA